MDLLERQISDFKKKIEEQRSETAKLKESESNKIADLKKDLVAKGLDARNFENKLDETRKEAESVKQQLERALMHKTKSQEQVRKLEDQLEKMMPIEEHEALVNQEL